MPYDVDRDPYVDASTGVMRNLLGITTNEELELAEARVASVAITKIMATTHLAPGDLTYDFFLSLHQQIFGAIYDWAGQLRTVEVSKGTTSFARAQYVEANLRALFQQLAAANDSMVDSKDELVATLAYYYGELNVLHPFREGNGRTIRTFLSLLAGCHGCYIAWDQMNPAENIQASIASYNGDDTPMRALLERITSS